MSYGVQTKLSDLNLKIKGSWVEECIQIVLGELKNKGIKFKPHFWISDEFFSPDGVPGVALPFYLFDPSFLKLENEMMGEAEGGNKEELLKILRHEIGHALDNAFHLRKLKNRQKLFGTSETDYPESYLPKVYSKSYVRHLEDHYAQAHPDEDWAETFAVWLNPKSNWQKEYKNWPALKKLNYLDEVFKGLVGKNVKVGNRIEVDNVKVLNKTIKEHYAEKTKRFYSFKNFFVPCFSKNKTYPSAVVFLKENRKEIGQVLRKKCNLPQYHVNKVVRQIINDCKQNNLRVKGPIDLKNSPFLKILSRRTIKYVNEGNHRIVM